MNKTAFLLTVFTTGAAVAFFLYQDKFKGEAPSLWNYVSDDAIAVMEFQRTDRYDEITKSKEGFVHALIAMAGDTSVYSPLRSSGLLKTLNSGELLASLHVTSGAEFGFTFFLRNDKPSTQEAAFSAIAALKADEGATHTVRSYSGKKIYEGVYKSMPYAYIMEGNAIVFSLHSFLIEDVVRMINGEGLRPFVETHADIMQMPALANDQGNLYVALSHAGRFAGLFAKPLPASALLHHIGKNAFLDVALTDKKLDMNGFTLAEQDDWLNTFAAQLPVKDRFSRYIPNDASSASKFLVSDAGEWQQQLEKYWAAVRPQFTADRNDFASTYNFDTGELFDLLKDGLCKIDIANGVEQGKLLLLSVSDVNEGLRILNTLTERHADLAGDSVYIEQYGSYYITELSLEDFPRLAFGPQFSGFDRTFFIYLDDLIVMGNTIEVLKNFITGIEHDETWGRSSIYSSFYDSGLEEINYSYAYNLQRLWPRLTKQLERSYQSIATAHTALFKRFRFGMVQFSRIDNSYYTNVSATYDPSSSERERKFYTSRYRLDLPDRLATRPFVVKNHTTGLPETLLQDTAQKVMLIGNDGTKLWSRKINALITTNVEQIDFYNNGKLQYFFAGKNTMHVIDRLGNYVAGYPAQVGFDVQDAVVVDYDNSKNYRFLLTDVHGNIYLFDKFGKLLDGWNPRNTDGVPASAPFHLRVRAKDCFIYQTQHGMLNVINRKGESLPLFPMDLSGKYRSAIYVQRGADLADTELHTLSVAGRLTKVSVAGKIVSNEDLYKQTKEAKFKIIPDESGKDYIIARREKYRLVLLDRDKKEILSKDYLGADELIIRYYYFNPEKRLYAVTDPTQEFTYLYNAAGQLINAQPLNSDKEVEVLFSENNNEFIVYKVHENRFDVLKF